ncbi:MAG: hypothetical protein BWY59_02543 [Verrucomicrobia bacterium ADurb.Bin345]|nr:MAG: hypothetical protein BWY59_02543 [Verrucomicrobia bacterium ADurb.Bin345]
MRRIRSKWIVCLCAAGFLLVAVPLRAEDGPPKVRTAPVMVRSTPDGELQPAPRPTAAADKKPFEDKKPVEMPFFVLNNKVLPPVMNFALSGFMGDAADLRVSGGYAAMLRDGFPSLRVTYMPAGNSGWSGAVWQNPANNWGTADGGYNLSKAKSLKFWARGERGDEIVSFALGGNSANYPDSDALSSGPIQITGEWLEYVVDLSEVDLRYISAGFGFSVKREENPYGCTFFLDDVRYE